MNYLLDFLNILAWPVAVVLLGYIFRRDINDAFFIHFRPQPQKIAYRMASIIDVAEKLAVEITDGMGGKPDLHSSEHYKKSHESLQRLAKASPRAAIIETWVEVEHKLLDVADELEIYGRGPLGSKRVLEKLIAQKKLPTEILKMYQSLREIRNKATHVPDYTFSNSDAERYFELYFLFVFILSNATGVKPTVAHISDTFSEK